MKHSLDHLPDSKRDELAAIVALIREAADVEMIILYGSHARGTWVDDPEGGYHSDWDVLVVVKSDNLAERNNLWAAVESRANRLTGRNTTNLIVHTIKDVNYQLEQGWYFFTDIKKEGIVLHDSGRHQLAEAKEKTAEERRAYAQDCFDKYFARAGRFYDYYEYALGRGDTTEAAFLLHQAVETYYKGLLLVYTAYRQKQHNIEVLGKQCANIEPALRGVFPTADAEDARRFKLLKAAYVDARYSLKFSISRADLDELAVHVRELRDRVQRVCRARIARM